MMLVRISSMARFRSYITWNPGRGAGRIPSKSIHERAKKSDEHAVIATDLGSQAREDFTGSAAVARRRSEPNLGDDHKERRWYPLLETLPTDRLFAGFINGEWTRTRPNRTPAESDLSRHIGPSLSECTRVAWRRFEIGAGPSC